MKVLKDFDFAHKGYEIKSYKEGEDLNLEDFEQEFIEVVLAEKWVEVSKDEKKSIKAAPENK